MTLSIVPLNQVQQLNRQIRGSRLTNLGSGGYTEAAVFEGVISTYSPAAGNKALVKGTFSTVGLGSNTLLRVQQFDNSRGLRVDLELIDTTSTAKNFECTLSSDDTIEFLGNNAANDGVAECVIEITETPE